MSLRHRPPGGQRVTFSEDVGKSGGSEGAEDDRVKMPPPAGSRFVSRTNRPKSKSRASTVAYVEDAIGSGSEMEPIQGSRVYAQSTGPVRLPRPRIVPRDASPHERSRITRRRDTSVSDDNVVLPSDSISVVRSRQRPPRRPVPIRRHSWTDDERAYDAGDNLELPERNISGPAIRPRVIRPNLERRHGDTSIPPPPTYYPYRSVSPPSPPLYRRTRYADGEPKRPPIYQGSTDEYIPPRRVREQQDPRRYRSTVGRESNVPIDIQHTGQWANTTPPPRRTSSLSPERRLPSYGWYFPSSVDAASNQASPPSSEDFGHFALAQRRGREQVQPPQSRQALMGENQMLKNMLGEYSIRLQELKDKVANIEQGGRGGEKERQPAPAPRSRNTLAPAAPMANPSPGPPQNSPTLDLLSRLGLSAKVPVTKNLRRAVTGLGDGKRPNTEDLVWEQPKTPLKESGSTCELLSIHTMKYWFDDDGGERVTLLSPKDPAGSLSDAQAPGSTQMRWLHIQQPFLEFEPILKVVTKCPLVTVDLLRVTLKTLDGAKKRFTRTSDGFAYFEPGSVLQQIGEYTGNDKGQTEPVLFLSCPSLELMSAASRSKISGTYRAESLLQSLYRYDVGQRREGRQVIQKSGTASPSADILHIDQTWFLLIGSSILITVNKHPAERLQRGRLALDRNLGPPVSLMTIRLLYDDRKEQNIVLESICGYENMRKRLVAAVVGTSDAADEYEILDDKGEPFTPYQWLELRSTKASHIRISLRLERSEAKGLTMSALMGPVSRETTLVQASSKSQTKGEPREPRNPLLLPAPSKTFTESDEAQNPEPSLALVRYGGRGDEPQPLGSEDQRVGVPVETMRHARNYVTRSEIRAEVEALGRANIRRYFAEAEDSSAWEEYDSDKRPIPQRNATGNSFDAHHYRVKEAIFPRSNRLVRELESESHVYRNNNTSDYTSGGSSFYRPPNGSSEASTNPSIARRFRSRYKPRRGSKSDAPDAPTKFQLNGSEGQHATDSQTLTSLRSRLEASTDAHRDSAAASWPFFQWRQNSEDSEPSGKTTNQALNKLLGQVNRSLSSQVKGNLYKRTFRCSKDELSKRQMFHLQRPLLNRAQESDFGLNGLQDKNSDLGNVKASGLSAMNISARDMASQEKGVSATIDSSPKDDSTTSEEQNAPSGATTSNRVSKHDHWMITEVFRLTRKIYATFLPNEGIAATHEVSDLYWGSIDSLLRQMRWNRILHCRSSDPIFYGVHNFRRPNKPSHRTNNASLENPWESCKECTHKKLYSSALDALDHLHKHHWSCGVAADRPFDDPCFAWIHEVSQTSVDAVDAEMERPLGNVEDFVGNLHQLQESLVGLQNLVSKVLDMTSASAAKFQPSLPKSLIKVFRRIIEVFIFRSYTLYLQNRALSISDERFPSKARDLGTKKIGSLQAWEREALKDIGNLIDDARRDIILMDNAPESTSMGDVEFMGTDFLALILIGNLQNQPLKLDPLTDAPECQPDHLDLYKRHISRLAFQAYRRPQRRVFLDIYDLQEELDAVQNLTETQTKLLDNFLLVTNPECLKNADKISVRRFEASRGHAHNLRAQLARKQEEIRILKNKSASLKEQVKQAIEILEEGHGKAIRVFTIVTLFFLPLSFVSTFLGMNTTDISGMDWDQRIFWVTSIPITVLVLGSAFLYGYKGDEVSDWMSSTGRAWKASLARRKLSLAERFSKAQTRRRDGVESGIGRQGTTDSFGF